MATKKQRYIESHWLTFCIKGALSLIAGFVVMMAGGRDANLLIKICGFTMLGLAIIEIFNTLHRKKLQKSWGLQLAEGIVEFVMAIFLLFTINPNVEEGWNLVYRVFILAIYMAATSVLSIVIGFTSFKDVTDRFMWMVSGALGAVLAIVTIAGAAFSDTTHVRLFGSYIMIKGLTELVFGVHSKNELDDLANSRAKAREEREKRKASEKKSK